MVSTAEQGSHGGHGRHGKGNSTLIGCVDRADERATAEHGNSRKLTETHGSHRTATECCWHLSGRVSRATPTHKESSCRCSCPSSVVSAASAYPAVAVDLDLPPWLPCVSVSFRVPAVRLAIAE